MAHLGMTIMALRKMRKMTQAELAAKIGLGRTSITNIEKGNQVVNEHTLNEIARALGYRVVVKFIALNPEREEDA